MLVNYQVKNRIAFIEINRPDKRNSLNAELVAQLTQSFEAAERDENVKVIVDTKKAVKFNNDYCENDLLGTPSSFYTSRIPEMDVQEPSIQSCVDIYYMYYVYALVLGAYANVKRLYKMGPI